MPKETTVRVERAHTAVASCFTHLSQQELEKRCPALKPQNHHKSVLVFFLRIRVGHVAEMRESIADDCLRRRQSQTSGEIKDREASAVQARFVHEQRRRKPIFSISNNFEIERAIMMLNF